MFGKCCSGKGSCEPLKTLVCKENHRSIKKFWIGWRRSGRASLGCQKAHQLIVMSKTYQQDSRATPESLKEDPDNRWHARGARYRLPSWMIRDSALTVSGLLHPVGGPPVRPTSRREYGKRCLWAIHLRTERRSIPNSVDPSMPSGDEPSLQPFFSIRLNVAFARFASREPIHPFKR